MSHLLGYSIGFGLAAFQAQAGRDESIFGDHLATDVGFTIRLAKTLP
jgi:hypothetical protein